MRKFLILILLISLFACKEPLDKNFEVVKDNFKVGYFDNPNEILFAKYYDGQGMMAVIVPKKIRKIGNK